MSSQMSSVDTEDKQYIPGEQLHYYNIHEDKFDMINANLTASSEAISKLLQGSTVSLEINQPDKNHEAPLVKDDSTMHQSEAQDATLPRPNTTNKEFTHRLTIANIGAVHVQESESVPEKESSRSTSPFVNTLPGYFTGHLERARRFGNVMETLKKPGHHVGPAKNPNCTCEHCKRWMSMGGATRGRAFSASAVQISRPYLRRDSKRNTSEEPESVSLGWADL